MSDLLDEMGKLKRQLEQSERQRKKLKRENTILVRESTVKDDRITQLTSETAAKDDRITKLKSETAAKSLHAVLSKTRLVVKLTCNGTLTSHMHPRNHYDAESVLKEFHCHDLIPYMKSLKRVTSHNPRLKARSSQLIAKYIKNIENPIARYVAVPTPNCPNEAAVACFVNVGLEDVTTICNAILKMSCGSAELAKLEVRPEMSIFSNRYDHVVVFDCTSNVPIFCVETKKHFDEKFKKSRCNRVLGQALDQLNAMRLEGQSRPLGALTCFNETYLTSLDPESDWDDLPTLQSLRATVEHLPSLPQLNTTPSPLEVNEAVPQEQRVLLRSGRRVLRRSDRHQKFTATFVPDSNRSIVRSKECVDYRHFVSALAVIVLNALQENYTPKPFQLLTRGNRIDVPCIAMTRDTYQWGKLTTTYQGPFKNPNTLTGIGHRLIQSKHTDLYLLRCIGTGSTSKVYHAITKDGFDCVVKLYVQRHNNDGTMKSKKKFQKDSIKHVTNEVNHYNKIYKNELKGYIWKQKLNQMDCIIMPFFQPIKVEDRRNQLPNIKTRLELFTKQKLAYRECDQSWRHVGRFNEKLYLFDLGDLETCTSIKIAKACASNHSNRLTNKMNESTTSTNSTISSNSSSV